MKDILITVAILFCILVGVLVGWLGLFPMQVIQKLDSMSWWILDALVLLVGIDLGLNKIWKKLRESGIKMLLLPLAVVVGTFAGALVACLILPFSFGKGFAISAGFGWYTLTSLLLGNLHGPELGALGFLANVFREMLTFLLFPLFHRFHKTVSGIAAGGATTMDTTLVLIDRVAGPEYAALAFIQGFVCSLLAPFLVPFLARL